MQSRLMLYSTEARNKLKVGIDALANMVKVTLGPKGRNVIIEKKFGGPMVTKDGVTVAQEVFLKDPIENMGAQLLKVVASRTAETAGDGTTTATVLAQAIVTEGIRIVTAGANPMDIKRGIDAATMAVVNDLKRLSKEVSTKEEIINVGAISANNDLLIGNLIADAMERVGKEGVITVEDAKSLETTVEVVEGMQFDRGYLSSYFITKMDTLEAVLDDVYVLLYDGKLSLVDDMLDLLNSVLQRGSSLLIIAEDVVGDAIKTLVVNKMSGRIKVCAVKAPGFGDRRKDILQDIAVLTGGTVISEELGRLLKTTTISDLGKAEKVIVNKDSTTVVNGKGKVEDVNDRVAQLKNLIDSCTSEYDKEKYQERLAKMTGGVAVLRVGAATETESKEKKMRIEDALHATRAAVDEGIVPGGGIAYLRARDVLLDIRMSVTNEDQRAGIDIVFRALQKPFFDLIENAGLSGHVVGNEIATVYGKNPEWDDYGYNALTDKYERLLETGVIDPTKVVRCALENASSIAGLFLTTEGVIAESLEEKKADEEVMNSQSN
jgi:chaperonin GroEL